jgi:hypothetical protein
MKPMDVFHQTIQSHQSVVKMVIVIPVFVVTMEFVLMILMHVDLEDLIVEMRVLDVIALQSVAMK